MIEKINKIMKVLLPKENRTKENIDSSIEEITKLKTSNPVENEFVDCFISLCNYLNGDKMGIYEVPKEMRVWFLAEYKCL